MPELPTSPNLVELTQRVFDAVDRRAFTEALVPFAKDAVWESEVLETSFEGVPAIKDLMEHWSAAYAAFEIKAEDIHDFGQGVVLCVFMNRPTEGVGEPSLRFALVIVWTDGAIRRVIATEDPTAPVLRQNAWPRGASRAGDHAGADEPATPGAPRL